MRRWATLTLLAASLGASSCYVLPRSLTRPDEEPPLDADESLMATGGPQTTIDLGEGGEQLLTRYQKVNAERTRLDQELSAMTAERDALQQSLSNERDRLERESNQRAGAESQREAMRTQLVDYQAKILALSLERAKLEQEVLRLKIVAVERQISELDGAQASPASSGRATASGPYELGTETGTAARPGGH